MAASTTIANYRLCRAERATGDADVRSVRDGWQSSARFGDELLDEFERQRVSCAGDDAHLPGGVVVERL
jgi:hypothetical protein